MNKSITDFFAQDLKAPLANNRWSWGSVDATGRTFLREWADQSTFSYADRTVNVFNPDDVSKSVLGLRERRRQVEAIRAGAPGFLVWIYRNARADNPWAIAGYNNEAIFPIEEIFDRGSITMARFGKPIAVRGFV